MPQGVYPRKRGLPRRTRSLIDRFWDHVQKTDGCWLWTGITDKNGYGRLFSRKGGGPLIGYRAHRLSWEIHFGAIPDALWVLHKCDTPQCVRPDHLFVGTVQDNSTDMVQKGRQLKGSRAPHSRLTATDVLAIRQHSDSGISRADIARMYSVTWGAIDAIVSGRTWRHL